MLSDGIIRSMVFLNPGAKQMCVYFADVNWIYIH